MTKELSPHPRAGGVGWGFGILAAVIIIIIFGWRWGDDNGRGWGRSDQLAHMMPTAAGPLRRAFSPAFRAGGMVLFIPWRVGAEESGAAKFGFGGAMLLDRLGPPGRCSGCWPHDGEVAGGAVADFVLVISGSRRRPRRSQVRGQLRHHPIATAG
jgi:hypothetical protein